MEDEVKKVSKKKILFLEIDEEITSIFERIGKLGYKEIYLVIPKRAVILQSVVNLKILKQKIEEIGKTLSIISNDANGMKLAHQAGIKVFDHHAQGKSQDKEQDTRQESTLLKPIAASSNDVDDGIPSRLPQKKSSIFEIVRDLKMGEKKFSIKGFLQDRKTNKISNPGLSAYANSGNKKFISALLFASLGVFGLIAYIALPGATIQIVPASTVVTKASNISLTKNPRDSHDLMVYNVASEAELTLTYHSSGTKSLGGNASGTVTIYNISNKNWPLIKDTRFQTDTGIVFRIKQEINVPRGNPDNPGEIQVTVYADPLDANGAAVGERGNIGPSKFFLPGLKEDTRQLLYAESAEYMTGGTTDVKTYVTDEDLLAAASKIEEELKEKALSALRKEVLAQATANNMTLSLLEDSDIIQYGVAEVKLPKESVGKETDTFEVTGTMKISGVAYDSQGLLSILKSEIMSTKTPGKKLVKIDDKSISINVFEVNIKGDAYKFTAQIQGIEEYAIDTEDETGANLVKKIEEHVAGKPVEEAESYIQNLPEVNSVEIKMWPFWSPTIPTLPDNIKIKSLSQEEVSVESVT